MPVSMSLAWRRRQTEVLPDNPLKFYRTTLRDDQNGSLALSSRERQLKSVLISGGIQEGVSPGGRAC